MRDGANINRSLLALANCINALGKAAGGRSLAYIPFRDSKLTRLLKDGLVGNRCATSRTLESRYDPKTSSPARNASRALRDSTTLGPRLTCDRRDLRLAQPGADGGDGVLAGGGLPHDGEHFEVRGPRQGDQDARARQRQRRRDAHRRVPAHHHHAAAGGERAEAGALREGGEQGGVQPPAGAAGGDVAERGGAGQPAARDVRSGGAEQPQPVGGGAARARAGGGVFPQEPSRPRREPPPAGAAARGAGGHRGQRREPPSHGAGHRGERAHAPRPPAAAGRGRYAGGQRRGQGPRNALSGAAAAHAVRADDRAAVPDGGKE
eukprot:1195617-Prorocentrum_minimum.AAC.3